MKTYGVSPTLAKQVWSVVDRLAEPADARWVARLIRLPVPTVRRALAHLERNGNLRSYDPPRARRRLYIAWVHP